MSFAYTYVLLCADKQRYIGSTSNLQNRLREHEKGSVFSTAHRRPVELIYYEACRSVTAAREREQKLKTGYGRAYLDRRLGLEK
ncbi:MAG: GIY-YIG nuclease family protein [Kiritimatiellales bacterium]|nr:GIY-YIG nuclease family protein [Kiritimatiellales bacterium]